MARSPNMFVDPNGVRAAYSWPINHLEEDAVGQHRNIQFSAPTGHLGLVEHQGDADPLVLSWKGTILTRAQLVEMLKWFQLCQSQTIFLFDFAGDGYEVTWANFDPTRKAVARNQADLGNAPLWIWEYTAQFNVITFLAGPFAEAGVLP